MSGSVYRFMYSPVSNRTSLFVRYIDLGQIVAVGMFVESDIIGVQVDCKHRDAPLVIEVISEPHLLSLEIEKVNRAMLVLVDAWTAYMQKQTGGA